MGTTAAESLNAAGNIFVGQVSICILLEYNVQTLLLSCRLVLRQLIVGNWLNLQYCMFTMNT